MNKRSVRLSSLLLCIFSQGVSLRAQGKPPGSNPDAEFALSASANGVGEIRLCQLATQNGMSSSVKEFAKRLTADHTKANEELKTIASQKGMAVSTAPSAKDGALYDTLSTLSGSPFDGAFISAMVTDHREDVAEFEKEAQAGVNVTLRDFAAKMLPVLKEDLKQAESAASELGVTPTPTGGR